MYTPGGIHVTDEFDRSAMMPYYLKAKASYPDLPDFDQIRFWWGTSYRTLGWAEPAKDGGAYYIVISRPWMKAIHRLHPDQYNREFEDTVLHELAHTSVQYREDINAVNLWNRNRRGKWIHSTHGREWHRTFAEATEHADTHAYNPKINWREAKKLAERIAKSES